MEMLLNHGTWAERDCDCDWMTWLGPPLGSDMKTQSESPLSAS